jgi:thioredoxin 1
MSDRLNALFLVVLLVIGIWAGVQLYKMWLRAQLGKRAPQTEETKPKLLLFTTPYCASCKQQSRGIEALEQELGQSVEVVRIDAAEQPEVAKQYGVLTAPSTFLVDAKGQVQAINAGFVGVEKLRSQLEEMTGGLPA